MDLKIIEKYLQAMMPPNPIAHDSVRIAFECMKAHPLTAIPTIGMMISRLQQRLYSLDEKEQAFAGSNVLVGVMIGWASENAELRKYIMEDYLEHISRAQGKNVVNFWQKKVEN